MQPSLRLLIPLAAAFLGSALSGCVVEEVRRPGYSTPQPSSRQPISLNGPIATPIPDATMSAQVRVEVRPLGAVKYDGLVLPLLSPDGRYLAVQEGISPTWPTILATDDAIVPMRTKLRVYDITGGAPQELRFDSGLPGGLLLGRSADDRGFLVESPRADGARWIGRVSWRDGGVEWLVKDENVNAHAVFTPDGLLVHTRRGVGEPRASLALRDRSMRLIDTLVHQGEAGGGTFLFPVCTGETGVVYALTGSDDGMGLEAIRISESGVNQGSLVFGAVEARKIVASHASPSMAYQCLAGLGYGLPAHDEADFSPLLIFHPRLERIVSFDRRRNSIAMLPEGTSAGVRSPYVHAPGYFLCTPEELIFTPGATQTGREAPVASILTEPYLPRLTTNAERPLMMLGFGRHDPLQINLLALYIPVSAGGDAE